MSALPTPFCLSMCSDFFKDFLPETKTRKKKKNRNKGPRGGLPWASLSACTTACGWPLTGWRGARRCCRLSLRRVGQCEQGCRGWEGGRPGGRECALVTGPQSVGREWKFLGCSHHPCKHSAPPPFPRARPVPAQPPFPCWFNCWNVDGGGAAHARCHACGCVWSPPSFPHVFSGVQCAPFCLLPTAPCRGHPPLPLRWASSKPCAA